ncbi:MAG: dockerin type I domain-containing protein [Acutalibacteraceae bacterium]|nr:dockerin type I domain-containing protein [Acutalibacteraceae bacterium]
MSKACRLTCVFLSVLILLLAAFGTTFGVSAANVLYYLDASDVNVRKDATTKSESLGKLSYVYLTKNGEKQGTDGYVWFNVTYGSLTGYIRSDFIKEITVNTDAGFEEQLNAFPESYRDYLRQLHAVYPNWKFYADNINLTLDEAVSLELVKKVTDYTSLSWHSMDLGSYDWGTGKWVSTENGRWYYVSREVIKYYMDPRNFLNANYIYTFLQQSYDPVHQTEAGLRKVISGTFLEKGYGGDTDAYVKDIMNAASDSGVNPYILAGTIIQEQGVNGTSKLISGTCSDYNGEYKGYYNFFNISANGEDPILNGLKYAKSKGWDTPSKAIIEGAEFCGSSYVSAGQNTYFYMNYNIKEPDRIWHQYATAVHNAADSGKKLASTYSELKDAELDFLIPVYKNMASSVSALPARNDNLNNYYFNSINVGGLTPSFNRFTYSYDLKISGDTTVGVSVPSGATYTGAAKYSLKKGNNTVTLTVKSQTGYTNSYVINVSAENDCVLSVDTSGNASAVMCGDTNADGTINGRDLANVQMHILSVKLLSGDGFTGGDTNKDGTINGRDLANIQMHILGVKSLN